MAALRSSATRTTVFFLIDVSTPARPREIGHALLPEVERQSIVARKKVVGPDCLTDLAVGDGVVYLAGQKSGLFLIPLGERAKRIARSGEEFSIPAAAKWNIPTGLVPYRVADVVRRLAVRGDELFAACSDEGVKRFAIRADGSLTETGTLPGRAYDVAVAGKDLLLVARGMTLDLYRILPQGFRKTGSIAGTFYNPFQVLHPFGNIVVCSGGVPHSALWIFPLRRRRGSSGRTLPVLCCTAMRFRSGRSMGGFRSAGTGGGSAGIPSSQGNLNACRRCRGRSSISSPASRRWAGSSSLRRGEAYFC
ncbi:MAG: hypothetical protein L6W00_19985 [Lentisphaeria bacterium]|nr:MAG: hypothetical protein L6W00_19985 [Lentisphaeria bacterium]